MPMLRCLWPSVLMYRAATALAAVLLLVLVLVLVHAAERDARDEEGAAARTTEAAADERPPKRAPAATGRWAYVRRRAVAMAGSPKKNKMRWFSAVLRA